MPGKMWGARLVGGGIGVVVCSLAAHGLMTCAVRAVAVASSNRLSGLTLNGGDNGENGYPYNTGRLGAYCRGLLGDSLYAQR